MKYTVAFPAGVALLLLMSAAPALGEETSSPAVRSAVAEPALTPEKPRQRLRFRNGPVCMCGDGLTESDIAGGREARRNIRATDKATPKE